MGGRSNGFNNNSNITLLFFDIFSGYNKKITPYRYRNWEEGLMSYTPNSVETSPFLDHDDVEDS